MTTFETPALADLLRHGLLRANAQAQGQHQPAARGQLIMPGGHHIPGANGQDNAIIGRQQRIAKAAIAAHRAEMPYLVGPGRYNQIPTRYLPYKLLQLSAPPLVGRNVQVPTNIGAGRTTFHFVNKGKVSHELNISLLKTGATVQQFMSAVNADTPTGAYREATVGVLFADKGKRSPVGLTTDLLPGRTYVVICINQERVVLLC